MREQAERRGPRLRDRRKILQGVEPRVLEDERDQCDGRREGRRALAARFLGAIGKLFAPWFATRGYERTKARLN